MTQEEWENSIIDWMTNGGWINDRDDETTLGFSFMEGEHHWIRDYDKKSKSFVHYDRNQTIELRIVK